MLSYKIGYFLFPAFLLISCGSGKKISDSGGGEIKIASTTGQPTIMSNLTATKADSSQMLYNMIQIKYAGYLRTSPQQIQNIRLYSFIDQWLATPYKWGGTDAGGIDCSAFMQRLLSEVYNIQIPRTSVQQFFDQWIDRFASSSYLSEGDLVFFCTEDDKLISHVGMYLQNRMFVNSSSSKGVSIACLDDVYWKRCYVAAGRIKILPNQTRK
jgi:murein DD-endopeptidase / murein LD-carboxypeptidase